MRDFKSYSVNISSFTYAKVNGADRTTFSLENIAFKAKKGDLVGIVGLSGSGKSTLLNILSGNIACENSKVTIDTELGLINIQDSEKYQREVSLVSQESHIFSETLEFNITMKLEKDPDFDRKFNVFKEHIPYLAHWGIKGNDIINPKNLSLGQKQLLAGIRALYLNKNIVFLDEISSALDPELELSLRNMVLMIQKSSLTIIVAHRIETILNANNILVMDNGRVVDSGNHVELLKKSVIYNKFIEELSHS